MLRFPSKWFNLNNIILITIFGFHMLPFLTDGISNFIVLAFMIIWIFVDLFNNGFRLGIGLWEIVVIGFFAVTGVISLIIKQNQTVFNVYVYNVFAIVFPYICYLSMSRQANKDRVENDLFFICNIIEILGIVAALYNIYYNYTSSLYLKYYRNAITYTVSYYLVLLCLNTLWLILCERAMNIRRKIYAIVRFVIYLTAVVISGFFIAIVTLFVGIGLLLIIKLGKNSIQKAVLTVGLLVFGCVLWVNAESILIWIASLINNHYYLEKINDIRVSLTNAGSAGSVEGRSGVYLESINRFIQSPLIGCVWRLDSSNIRNWIGYHSSILDQFALFGIMGGLLNIFILSKPFDLLNHHDQIIKTLIYPIYFCFLIISAFDNAVAAMGIIVYFYTQYHIRVKQIEFCG